MEIGEILVRALPFVLALGAIIVAVIIWGTHEAKREGICRCGDHFVPRQNGASKTECGVCVTTNESQARGREF